MSEADTLPGLLTASFRGIEFFMPDASTAPGRRLEEYLFPGIDRAAYDDFGELPEEINVEGVLVGDDYIAQARALRAAFRRAGPGTLVHPWLGAMTVIAMDPPDISFSAGELRVARFSATFKVYASKGSAAIVSTVQALLGAASTAQAAAAALAAAPATVTISAAQGRASARSARVAADIWTGLVAATAAANAIRKAAA